MMNAHEILIKPVITEKATIIAEQNKYVFRVSNDANKDLISKAIKEIYNVLPVRVNIVNVRGKEKSLRLRSGRTSAWKKAIVTLKEGDKIELFETK
ncbi:MAG TPA: 50S ribosomal protein L23 [Spirochaetota bacterium]|nr:50S ribosomal protein L23 [Spirochaetota bacterium]